MKKKLVVAGLTSMLGLTSGIGVARADGPVGEAGEPNCHGKRVSHGSSYFGDTPKDRAGYNDISVREFQERVRRCDPPPPHG